MDNKLGFVLLSVLIFSIIPANTAFADEDDDDQKTKFKKHKVHTGDGPPPHGLGKVGDLYIDSSDTGNLIIYKKTDKKTWTNLGSFQGEPGPSGPQGPQGEKGDKGNTGEQGAAGQDGLNCWDLDGDGIPDLSDEDANGDGIVDVLDCEGPKGDKGDKGDTGEIGPSGPQGEQGPAGTEHFVFVMQQGNSAVLNEVTFGAGTGTDAAISQGTAISWDGDRNVFIISEDGFYEVTVTLTVVDSERPSTFEQVRLSLVSSDSIFTPSSWGHVGFYEQMSYHLIGQFRSGQEISAKIVTLNPADGMSISNLSTMSVKKLT